MEMKASDRVTVSPEVLSQEVGGETVLLDLRSDFYFGLDEIGTRVWQLLQSGLSLQELIDMMLDEYEVKRETLEADVGELLDKLLAAHLVSIDSLPPS